MVYKKYSWGNKHHGVNAQVAGEVMESIEKRDGILTKEAFLEESRPEESPTHKCFEWDDTKAAEKYRLHQSRDIINDIVVTVIKEGGEEEKAPAFVNVVIRNTNVARYASIGVAMNDEDMRMTVLRNAFDELSAFKKKYELYVELKGVFAEADKARVRFLEKEE